MGKIVDIRKIKRDLRQKYRGLREEMDPVEKEAMDQAIYERLTASRLYQSAETLLCFVSTGIEVDTRRLLQRAFQDGKTVAVPCCLNEKGAMDFFVIHGMDDLRPSTFGLLEPDPAVSRPLRNYRDSVCIVPGFAFDAEGYRIGFGKGFYDRFLQRYPGKKIGICYNSCMAAELPRGRYDVAADYIVTPKYIKTIQADSKKNNANGGAE